MPSLGLEGYCNKPHGASPVLMEPAFQWEDTDKQVINNFRVTTDIAEFVLMTKKGIKVEKVYNVHFIA